MQKDLLRTYNLTVVPVVPAQLRLGGSNGNVGRITNKPAGAAGLRRAEFARGHVTPVNIVNNNITGPLADNLILTPIGSVSRC